MSEDQKETIDPAGKSVKTIPGLEALPVELRNDPVIQRYAGTENPVAELAKAHVHLKREFDGRIRLPEKADDTQGWEPIRKKMGLPVSVEDFKDIPDDGLGKPLKEIFLRGGMKPEAAKEAIALVSGAAQKINDDQRYKTETEKVADEAKLRVEWGKDFEDRFRFTSENLPKLEAQEKEIYELLKDRSPRLAANFAYDKLEKFRSESARVSGVPSWMTKEQATKRSTELEGEIAALRKDNKDVSAQWDELQRVGAYLRSFEARQAQGGGYMRR